MRIRISAFLVPALAAFALLQSGCAHRGDLFASGALRLEKNPERRGHYRDIRAQLSDAGIQVVGFVRRSTAPAHVHVAVEDVHGELLATTRAEVRRVPRSARRVRHARFEAWIPQSPPIGSIVRIRHHIGACDELGDIDARTRVKSNGS